MDDMLYVAMSGAKETLIAQAAATNNLANVSTTGFRADLRRDSNGSLVMPSLRWALPLALLLAGCPSTQYIVAPASRSTPVIR